jgi:acetyl esterase/lipase
VRACLPLLAALLLAAPASAAAAVRHDVAYGTDRAGPLLGDVYRPAHHRRIAVVTVHGGSWLYNSRATLAPIAAELARRSGFVVLNIDYPLGPAGAALPARQHSAVEQAVRWLRAHAPSLGIDPRRIGALGSSAGGNLVGLAATGGTGSLRTGARLAAAVTWSGQLDLEHVSGQLVSIVERYLGCSLLACPDLWMQASPIDHVNHGDTPMLLFASRHDTTPPSQSIAMAGTLRRAGVQGRAILVPGSAHAQHYAAAAMARTIAFLRRHLVR